MIQSSKILTVSYGTFSCTLEGFEDSFDTMKVIAEYFRDLAADDRYFGAEPPVPDADMLARIAEKEIARRVEAHQDTDGVHLRAAIPDAVAAPAAPAPDPEPEVEIQPSAEVQPKPKQPKVIIAAAPVAAAPVTPAPIAIDDVVEVEADVVEDTPDIIDGVMNVLEASDSESADGESADALADADDMADAEVAAENANDLYDDEDYEDVAETPFETPLDLSALTADDDDLDDDAYEDDPAEDDVQSTPQPDVDLSAISASLANAPQIEVEDEIEIDEEPVFETPVIDEPVQADPNSVAAKLARIRQVVSTKPSANNDGFSEDEHADVEAVETATVDLDEVASQDAAPADTIANVLDQMRGTTDDVEDNVEAPAEDVMDTVEDHVDPIEDTVDDVPPPAPITPKRRPVKARVMKVKRAEFQKAVSSGLLEEVEDDEDDVPAPVAPSRPTRASTLSAQDEADLQAALAEVTAELDEDDVHETPVAATPQPDKITPKAGRNMLMRSGVGEEGSDVDRLLDKADSEMAEPTGRQRRNAISHLRAAVAATRDDEELTNSNDTEKSSEAYRSDLEDVVRPRRPVSGREERAERPGQSRPAPLQLVAEQRIDEAEEEALAPVRPRRVSAAEDLVEEDADDDTMVIDGDLTFEEFAEEMGASDLPDLLEAAASYMSFVEKRPGFSRPQLMTKVRQVEATDYSREDRLRSFGVLLREGKIQKTQGGQFTASDRISFRPDEDRAAG